MKNYKVKKGAKITSLNKEIKDALVIMAAVYLKYGYTMVVTAGTDGKHMQGSKHYTGDAVDLRIWGIQEKGYLKIIANEMQEELDGFLQGFQVVIECDHYHVEFDLKNWKPQRHFKL